MSRSIVTILACAVAATWVAACGGSPNGPAAVTQPPAVVEPSVPAAPPNNLPTIESVTAQGRRAKEPAGFADLQEPIDLVARVRDDETAIADLEFQWTANAGAFEGTGPNVTWRAPSTAQTPLPVTVTLKVIERYGYPGGTKNYQHDVSSSVVISLHDSAREVGGMARQFLLDFSDSNIRDVSSIMRNFQPGCYGTKDETDQVTENRRRYKIIEWRVGDASTSINFGGICPYGAKRGDACTAVPVTWKSIDLDKNNAVGSVSGTDWLASFYYPDQQRWRLCDSSFEGHSDVNMRDFIR
jgi:hypothetical protein